MYIVISSFNVEVMLENPLCWNFIHEYLIAILSVIVIETTISKSY